MKNKQVIVGVTGGIAAYKAAELVRLLVREGASTNVVMTAHATKFVTPLTFEALSGRRVVSDMWDPETRPMDHISLGQDADLIIIAPATANFIAQMAQGIGSDFLSTMILAATAKILVCPSMNVHMYSNPAVQDNIKILKKRGYFVMDPCEGELACGTEGAGRLPEPEDILDQSKVLVSDGDLSGMKILVTAGPTMEDIDPVRYITNRSSGKMGYALADAARLRGADVTLISGPTSLRPPTNVRLNRVKTTDEMKQAVFACYQENDVIIKAAAVLDYKPRETAGHKIKKEDGNQSLELVRTPDILEELGRAKEDTNYLLVGFAAETEDLLSNASQKLARKNLDMIVANDVSRDDAGFETDTNLVRIIYRDGEREDLPLMKKQEVANHLLGRIKRLWKKAS
jgi:phosphopantothenoylcysteine decarboxylase/phosphopantothenate--cysteine ligase